MRRSTKTMLENNNKKQLRILFCNGRKASLVTQRIINLAIRLSGLDMSQKVEKSSDIEQV